ncbi:MAG: alpha/beta hydrolase [Lachnospiraceae bacterium]|nr:alpha/beta hydrolase [Lachnospiraceae bacterium]
MEILEFGDKGKKKIILIHGFQSPYQVWNKYIEHYKKDFCIIVPIMPGHNPNIKEDFVSFSKTAEELENYYILHYGNNVYAVFGMSMGGVLAATLWQNEKLHIDKVIFDGSPIVSLNCAIRKFMINFYINITHKSQQRDKKTMRQATKSIIPQENFGDFLQVLDSMSDVTIANCINSIADFKLRSDIDSKHTKIYFYHGTAANEILAKKSAKFILRNYPDAVIKCFKGKSHCEVSLFYPELMIKELDSVLM